MNSLVVERGCESLFDVVKVHLITNDTQKRKRNGPSILLDTI